MLRAAQMLKHGGSRMPACGTIHVITLQDFEAACRGERWRLRPGEASVDLEIYWHVVNYLVTGDAESTFLQSGVQMQPVSEEGHFEVHSPQDVAALHARLSTKSAAELMSRFSSTKFDELGVYGLRRSEHLILGMCRGPRPSRKPRSSPGCEGWSRTSRAGHT